ncbi:MAG TPA: hypothetical protein VEH27_11615 [Methylomirabilota bacterium]|nr:hypothetical protein [Methylomirabilota bacterium]
MKRVVPLIMSSLLAAGITYGSAAVVPSIQLARTGEKIEVTFTGALQMSTNLGGAWLTLTNATSPFQVEISSPRAFFRAAALPAASIFASTSVVQLTVTGPLQKHFELAHAGMPDGIFPPLREKPYFDGSITHEGATIPASLRVRGNSSLQECPFPKLKFKISSVNRAGTAFAEAREVKIGTHCAEGGRGPIGRLREQIATYREALAYEALALIDAPAPKVRRAEITYKDTTSTNDSEMVGWELTRQALLVEDVEVIAERIGGRALKDEEVSALKDPIFDEQLVTNLRLFNALIGNWDYSIGEMERGLWNVDVIEMPDRSHMLVAGDFDLASWVTGQTRLMAPHDYRPDLPDLERQAHYEVDQVQQRVSPTSFLAALQMFAERRAALEALVQQSLLDAEGRTNALAHINAFYAALPPIKP